MSGETCICDDSFGVRLQEGGGRKGRRTNRNSPPGAAQRRHILALSSSSGVAAGLRIILKPRVFTTTPSRPSPDYLCWSKATGQGCAFISCTWKGLTLWYFFFGILYIKSNLIGGGNRCSCINSPAETNIKRHRLCMPSCTLGSRQEC